MFIYNAARVVCRRYGRNVVRVIKNMGKQCYKHDDSVKGQQEEASGEKSGSWHKGKSLNSTQTPTNYWI